MNENGVTGVKCSSWGWNERVEECVDDVLDPWHSSRSLIELIRCDRTIMVQEKQGLACVGALKRALQKKCVLLASL